MGIGGLILSMHSFYIGISKENKSIFMFGTIEFIVGITFLIEAIVRSSN